MKAQNLFRTSSFILSLLFVTQTFGQRVLSKYSEDYVLADIINPTREYSVKTAAINAKSISTFVSLFNEASNISWVKVGNKDLARFTYNGKLTKALFSKKGHLVYTIVYGKENDLPSEVHYQLKRNYLDYSITQAIEIKEEGRNIWVVQLENTNSLVLVRSENGDFEEMKQYKKSL